jgi:predicted XRE-type DNA-binding protein
MKTADDLTSRFWSKVKKAGADECWLWTASTAGKGYGQIKIPKTRRQVYAHRFSYELHKGAIPKGAQLRHSCDNPRCVNPRHLITGTSGDNHADMVSRDRHLYGERNGNHRITEDTVELILDALTKGGMSQDRIAKAFGVSQMTVSRIARGERWHYLWLKRQPSTKKE